MTEANESTNADAGRRLSAGLGPLPEDELRQQAFVILSRLQSGTEDVVRLDAALAAVAAERERWRALLQEALDADTNDYMFGSDLADRMRAALRA